MSPAQPKFNYVNSEVMRAIEKTTRRLSLRKANGTPTVAVVKQGNFTVVMLKDSGFPGMGVGVAKRSTRDKYNGEAGFYLALHRATLMLYPKLQIADLMQELHENLHGIQGVFYAPRRDEEQQPEVEFF